MSRKQASHPRTDPGEGEDDTGCNPFFGCDEESTDPSEEATTTEEPQGPGNGN